jgi:hypothetical protein
MATIPKSFGLEAATQGFLDGKTAKSAQTLARSIEKDTGISTGNWYPVGDTALPRG